MSRTVAAVGNAAIAGAAAAVGNATIAGAAAAVGNGAIAGAATAVGFSFDVSFGIDLRQFVHVEIMVILVELDC